MTRTITGAEFRDFYKNHWPAGSWHEDADYAIEDDFGNWILADDQVLDLERMGYVVSEEAGSKPVWRPFAEVWEAWLDQAPPVRIITWRVPAELVDEVEAFMAERGIERVGASDVDAPKDAPDGP